LSIRTEVDAAVADGPTSIEEEDYILPSIPFSSSVNSSSFYPSLKEGTLYKQSDHLKIWKPRHFILNQHFLHSYLHKEDTVPRMSWQMIRGIRVTPVQEPKLINGYQMHVMTISHPETSTEYQLATTLEERDLWISMIQHIINGEHISTSISMDEEDLQSGDMEPSFTSQLKKTLPTSSSSDSNSPNEPFHRHLVDYGVPITLKEKIDSIAATILDYSSPEFTRDWPIMYEKDGVKGARRPGSGLICVRGESLLPYTIPEIFSLALNPMMKKVVDPNVDQYERGKWFNFHTGHEYMKSKGSWPTSPRDFSSGTHWRLLNNGKFLNFAFGEDNPEFPEQQGVVRARLNFGGYVMKHVTGGTMMTFLLQVDIGGSVPLAIANFVGQSKPLTLLALRKVLDDITKGKARPDLSSPLPPPNYEGGLHAPSLPHMFSPL
jgi:hypothetical protein